MQACAQGGDGRSNPWLDLVRAIAILLVLLRHGERAFHAASDTPPGLLETLFINGWVGVDVFFVLSGYLIARHLVGAGIGSGQFKFGRYLAMRGLRIIPAYLAVLMLILVGAFPFYTVPEQGLATRVAYHLLFLQDYLPSDINVVFWSLGVEEKFYLLAPLLMLALLRCRTIWLQVMLLLALFTLPILSRTWGFLMLEGDIEYEAFFRLFRSPFHMTVEGLIVGVSIATAQQAGLVRVSRKAGLALLSLTVLGLFVWLASHDFMATIGTFDTVVQPSLIAIVAGLMTLGAVQLADTRMPLTRIVRAVSRLSYSLYLVHFPLIPLVMFLASSLGSWAFWSCYLSVSFLAALVLHVAVEKPFLTWKDRLSGRTRADRPARRLAFSGH